MVEALRVGVRQLPVIVNVAPLLELGSAVEPPEGDGPVGVDAGGELLLVAPLDAGAPEDGGAAALEPLGVPDDPVAPVPELPPVADEGPAVAVVGDPLAGTPVVDDESAAEVEDAPAPAGLELPLVPRKPGGTEIV